jgi:hypothetical protein
MLKELQIGEDLKEILFRQVSHIKSQPTDKVNLQALEKLSKIYVMMMGDLRENEKSNLFDKLTDQQALMLIKKKVDS